MTIREFMEVLEKYSDRDEYLFYFENQGNLFPVNTIKKDKDDIVLISNNSNNGRKKKSLSVNELRKKLSSYNEDLCLYYQDEDKSKNIRADLSLSTNPDEVDTKQKIIIYKIPIMVPW